MGHLAGKDIYRKLGKKIDNLTMKAPWNDTLYAILKELYSSEEAELVVKMPYNLSNLDRIQRITDFDKNKLKKLLDQLSAKGLIMDVFVCDDYYYMPSPMVIGIFEFTMMRSKSAINFKKMANLFHHYLQDEGAFYEANFNHQEQVSVARALPHEDALPDAEYVEVLDYERATSLINESDKYALGICSCRHEKLHNQTKKCNIPLETCSTFGWAADFVIRNGLGVEVSKAEILDKIAQSKDLGLVLTADNVQKQITYLCHCCSCCCNILLGVSKFGYTNTIVTSTYLAEVHTEDCIGCGKCAAVCPAHSIEMIEQNKNNIPLVNISLCLGCGVCALKCSAQAIHLQKRKKRIIYPETTFERVILQSLERGNLQNQLFDNPQSISQKVMRCILGAFFRLPAVKKSLMSNTLSSVFLKSIKRGTIMRGRGWFMRKNYRGGRRKKSREFLESNHF